YVAASATGALNLTGVGEPERLITAWASADLFPALGIPPLLGRTFSPEEDRMGNHLVAILSQRLWQRRFGGDPNVVGASMMLNGRSRTVLGVMPASFQFPAEDVDLWVPLAIEPDSADLRNHYLGMMGHLRPGATLEQAKAERTVVLKQIEQRYPEYYKDADG